MLISGTVIIGKQRGRKLGFPTVNISLGKMVSPGVYGGWVLYEEKRLVSAIYVHQDQKLLEAHILDFEGDLYGQVLEVELGEKIRDPKYFNSIKMLKIQISQDVEKIREMLYGK